MRNRHRHNVNAIKRLVVVLSMALIGTRLLAACGVVAPTAAAPPEAGEESTRPALQALAAQLGIDAANIRLGGTEPVQWPDACLGIQKLDKVCSPGVVLGYRITLEAGGRTYAYRTNEDGSLVVPEPKLTLTWKEGEQCQEADLSYEGLNYVRCGGSATLVPFANRVQAQELAGFASEFASFEGPTPVGALSFFGGGGRAMSPAEQRMMAEWARAAVEEVGGGSVGPVIAWHREGGIAGFCDDLSISTAGSAVAASCKGGQSTEVARYRLTPDELEQLYTWVDTLESFEFEQTDPATADVMTVRLTFNGLGASEATESDRLAIESFAAELYLQLGE